MSIEDLLREAAAKGLTHLSLHPVHSEDHKTVYWRASATPSTQHSYVQTANLDPAEAVRVVLEALPRAPRRKAPTDKQLTAAVTAVVEPSDLTGLPAGADPLDLHQGNEWDRFKT